MKISTQTFEVFQSPAGSVETITLYEFDSEKPGPEVYLQASVHGAEVQGNLVLFLLAQQCQAQEFSGKIRFVPLANPRATNQKIGTITFGRFNPITGHNWNRNYTDLARLIDYPAFVTKHKNFSPQVIKEEFKKLLQLTIENERKKVTQYGPNENKLLNLLLQELASSADIVLDLHTGPIACRYLYVPEYLKERSKDLLFPFTIVIPHEFAGAMDEACFVPWVKLAQECEKQQCHFPLEFESYTVELSSEERVCSKMAQEDLKRLSHYLGKRGVFTEQENHISEKQLQSPLSNYKTYYAPVAGLCEFLVSPGQLVSKGEVLAKIYSWQNVQQKAASQLDLDSAITVIKAFEQSAVINFTTSSIVSEGMELFQLLENPQQ